VPWQTGWAPNHHLRIETLRQTLQINLKTKDDNVSTIKNRNEKYTSAEK
jgi:hypothetical protein